MALPIRPRPSFTHSQSLPPGSFHKPLIFIHQRADRLKKHSCRKLTTLITLTTALSNSVKLWAMLYSATQDIMVERSDKTWSTGERNGKLLHYSCLENPMNSMKKGKDMTLKDELPRSVGAQYTTGDQWKITPERMKGWSQSKNNTQLWMWLLREVKSDAVKNNIA